MRLHGTADIPAVVRSAPPDYQEGDQVEFFASNVDTLEKFTITARLVYGQHREPLHPLRPDDVLNHTFQRSVRMPSVGGMIFGSVRCS